MIFITDVKLNEKHIKVKSFLYIEDFTVLYNYALSWVNLIYANSVSWTENQKLNKLQIINLYILMSSYKYIKKLHLYAMN